MSVESLSASIHSDESSLESRLTKLQFLCEVPMSIPRRIATHPRSTYGDITRELAAIGLPDPVVLQPIYGPRPYWVEADPERHVEVTTQPLHVIIPAWCRRYTLGLVRTAFVDYPIAIIDRDETTAVTVYEAINHSIPGLAHGNLEIRGHSSDRLLANEQYRYEALRLEEQNTFPTVFFITQDQLPDKFQLDVAEETIPPFLQSAFIQCKYLVRRAYDLDVPSLQVAHLSTSLLHLIISTAKAFEVLSSADEDDGEAALDILELTPTLATQLHGLLDRISLVVQNLSNNGHQLITTKTEMESIFDCLCGDIIGAVTVRHSHLTFKKMGVADASPCRTDSMNLRAATPLDTPAYGSESAPSLEMFWGHSAAQLDSIPEANASQDSGNRELSITEILRRQTRQVEESKEELGDAHPATLRSMLTLASTYNRLNRHRDAEKLQSSVIAAFSGQQRHADPDNLRALAGLFTTYRALSQYDKASELQNQALDQSKASEMPHLDISRIALNLASNYRRQGRYSEAMQLQTDALEGLKQTLGEGHTDTLIEVLNLSKIYHALGRYAEAEELRERPLKILTERLGQNHPTTLEAMLDVASTYTAFSQFAEAQAIQDRVLKTLKLTLGRQHPTTRAGTLQSAATYAALGNHVQAKYLQVAVMEDLKESLGPDHPDTLVAMRDLASTYNALGHHFNAKHLQQAALSGMMEKLGETHADTLITMLNLAVTYRMVGPRHASHDLHRRLSRGLREQEGQSVAIFAAIYNFALTYRTKRAKKMVSLMQRIQQDISARKPVDYNVAELFDGLHEAKKEAEVDIVTDKVDANSDTDMDSDALHSDMEIDA